MIDPGASTTPSPIPKMTDDEIFAEGDMVLVSSNNVRFRVPSYYLLAASGVIRDMYHPGGDSKDVMHLTDPDIEHSNAVRAWLSSATGVLPSDDLVTVAAKLVLPLARKYDCPQMIFTIVSLLHKVVDGGKMLEITSTIATAAECDRPDLVTKVILRNSDMFYSAPDLKAGVPVDDLSCIVGGSCLDPTSWGISAFRSIPHDYIWALLRTNPRFGARGDGMNPIARADKFMSLISQLKQPPQSKKRKADDSDEQT